MKKLPNGQQVVQTTDGSLYTHKMGNISGDEIYQKIDGVTGKAIGNPTYYPKLDDAPTAADFIPKDPNYKGLYSATPKLNDLDGTTMPHYDAGTFDGKSWSGGKMYIPKHRGGK